MIPFAQDNAWNKLLILSDALPQGLIFIGPPGVGKKLAAKALFQKVNCEIPATAPCGHCPTCFKVEKNTHTDLLEILPKGEQIQVADLREMKKTLFFPPMEAKQRFVLIDNAHKLNASSANSLLKILEEPPAHTRFILITHERDLLPVTIVSRCQFIHFNPLDNETILNILEQNNIELPEHSKALCLDLMAGGLEKAELFQDSKVLTFIEGMQNLLEGKGRRDLSTVADQMGPEPWKLELYLALVLRQRRLEAIEASKNSDFQQCNQSTKDALDSAYLQQRLGRYANKKLMALAAASNLLDRN